MNFNNKVMIKYYNLRMAVQNVKVDYTIIFT